MIADTEAALVPEPTRGTAILTSANLIILVTVAASAPLLARLLGPGARGELAAAFSLFMILRFVAPLGLLEASTRALYWRAGSTPAQVGRASLPIALAFGTVLAVATWMMAPLVFPDEPNAVLALQALAFLLPVFAIADVMRGLMVAERAYLAAACVLVSPWLGRFVAAGVMFVADDSRLALIAFFSAAGIIPGLAVAMALYRPSIRRTEPIGGGWALRRQLLSFGSRATFGSAASLADRRIDQVLMLPLASSLEAGLYVVAVTVAEIPDALTRSVRSVLLAEHSKEPSTEAFLRTFRTTLAMVIVVAAGIAITAPIAIPLVFGDAFGPAVPATLILLVATIPLTVQALAGTGLYLADQPGRYGAIRIVGVVTNVVLLSLLAPSHGAVGAAFASLGAYTVTAIISLRSLRSSFDRPPLRRFVLTRDDLADALDQLGRARVLLDTRRRAISPTPVIWFLSAVVVGLIAAVLVVAAPALGVGLALAIVAAAMLLRSAEPPASAVASLYLVLVVFPVVRGVPQEISFGAFTVDAHLLLLPLLVLPALRTRPSPTLARPVVFFSFAVTFMALWGVASGAPLLAVVQDLRLPLMFIGGFMAGLIIIRQRGVGRLAQIGMLVTGATAALILLQLTTSISLLEGRVRAATNISRSAADLASATRFLVSSEDLALVILVLSVFVLALRWAPLTGVWGLSLLSGIVVLTQSLSRQLIVGLLIASFLSMFIRRTASRLITVAVVGVVAVGLVGGLAGLAADFGLLPGEESTVGVQAAAFEERVLGGFRSETLAGDQGISWRSRENDYASAALSEQLFTGVGLGRPYRPEVRFEPFGSPTFFRRWVHNLYLSYGAKGGLIGLSALVWVMLAPLLVAWKRARTRGLPDVGSSLAAVMLPAFAVMSLVDPVYLNSPTGAVTGCLLAILALDATAPRSSSVAVGRRAHDGASERAVAVSPRG
ncbi:MAG: polysaccharide biosynthesis C-terminal domain-containing protein [Acidimicrobiia bacterium]|nr:polysaccharide biosynthesis C-terminal domain-containing protein [Acidimicrobiia bacterium]